MNMRLKLVAVLLLGLCGATPGFAHYNPSMGRWLSRDPIEENGAIVLYKYDSYDSVGKKDALNLYEFAGNNGTVFIDGLGAVCIDPCRLAKEVRLNISTDPNGDAGGVICCGGKKYACVWDTGTAKNSKAKDIISRCISLHEWEHFDETEDCPLCSFWPSRPPQKPGEGECRALTVEYECLKRSYASGGCGDDSNCKKEVLEEMLFVLQQKNQACKINIGPRPSR